MCELLKRLEKEQLQMQTHNDPYHAELFCDAISEIKELKLENERLITSEKQTHEAALGLAREHNEQTDEIDTLKAELNKPAWISVDDDREIPAVVLAKYSFRPDDYCVLRMTSAFENYEEWHAWCITYLVEWMPIPDNKEEMKDES